MQPVIKMTQRTISPCFVLGVNPDIRAPIASICLILKKNVHLLRIASVKRGSIVVVSASGDLVTMLEINLWRV